jgi:hypothetical protein
MPATNIPIITPVRTGSFTGQPVATSLDYVETASGGVSWDAIPLNGLVLACLSNTAGTTQTFTAPSEADAYGRTLPITTYSQATTIRSAILLSNAAPGWRNADGTWHAYASAVTSKWSCFSIPGIGAPWSGTSLTQAGRTAINPVTPMGPWSGPQAGSATSWPVASQPNALALDYTMSAMDASNGNCIIMNGPLLLLFTDSGSNTMTISATNVGDNLNRSVDITTYAVGSGLFSAIYVRPEGFRQTNGYLYLTASNAAVKVAAFACPG